MQPYQRAFFDFVISTGALRFGEFTLKSGRVSPYFFNAGHFDCGSSIAQLTRYYAAAIEDAHVGFDMLFGPAYKGIPLAVATSIALYNHHERDVPFAFNRKEAKDHGEGGNIVGAPLEGRVMIIDDVISAGTSVRESTAIIEHAGATIAGIAIALDRQERGQGPRSAIDEIRDKLGVPVISIATLKHLCTYLQEKPAMKNALEKIEAYREAYGSESGNR